MPPKRKIQVRFLSARPKIRLPELFQAAFITSIYFTLQRNTWKKLYCPSLSRSKPSCIITPFYAAPRAWKCCCIRGFMKSANPAHLTAAKPLSVIWPPAMKHHLPALPIMLSPIGPSNILGNSVITSIFMPYFINLLFCISPYLLPRILGAISIIFIFFAKSSCIINSRLSLYFVNGILEGP